VTKPHPDADRLVATWSNTLGALSATQITAVDTHYNPKTGDFWLFLGDDIGEVKIQDLRVIIERLDLKPIVNSSAKRAPKRVFEINFDQMNNRSDPSDMYQAEDEHKQIPKEMIKEGLLK